MTTLGAPGGRLPEEVIRIGDSVVKYRRETIFGVKPGTPLLEPEIRVVGAGTCNFISRLDLSNVTVTLLNETQAKAIKDNFRKVGMNPGHGAHYGDYTNFYKAFANMTTKRKVKRAANILVKANRKNGTPCDPRKTYRELAKFRSLA